MNLRTKIVAQYAYRLIFLDIQFVFLDISEKYKRIFTPIVYPQH